MNTSPPARIPGRVLVAVAGVLAAAGCVLLALGLSGTPAAAPDPPAAPASPPSLPVDHTGSASLPAAGPTARIRQAATPTASAASPSARASELPPPGSGPSADPMVQRALDRAIRTDLPTTAAKRLTALGRAVWTAEVTGTGRRRWPAYFTGPGPSAAYTRVRIQAAIARREAGHAHAAVVHLVWAGADPSGTYLDGRTATVRFRMEKDTWTPVR